jgi:thermostable 8-oxoguanine DNA glycosylase
MVISDIKLYELLKARIGEREAEAFVEILEKKVDSRFEEKKSEFILEKDKDKLLTKADALAIFSTKEDLANTKVDIIKWLVGTAIAIISLVIAGIKLL